MDDQSRNHLKAVIARYIALDDQIKQLNVAKKDLTTEHADLKDEIQQRMVASNVQKIELSHDSLILNKKKPPKKKPSVDQVKERLRGHLRELNVTDTNAIERVLEEAWAEEEPPETQGKQYLVRRAKSPSEGGGGAEGASMDTTS